MGTETISRHDNTVVWEMRDDDDAVVMATVVRTFDGDTVALTREGTLVHRDDTEVAVELVGVDPQSLVVANSVEFVADEWGRVSFAVNSDDELAVSFVNDGVTHTTTHELSVATSATFVDTTLASFVFVLMACVVAWSAPANRWRAPANRQRRLRGAPT